VSSFGISGTNAHVILEAPDPDPEQNLEQDPGQFSGLVPWVVSAKTETALTGQLDRVAALAGTSIRAVDAGYSLAAGRSVFPHRAVLLAAPDGGVTEVARGVAGPGRLAWLFPGQGSQRLGMGRELYERFPVFAEALDGVCAGLDEHLDRPVREVMWGADEDLLNHTGFAQPALFAVGVALARLLDSWGIRPD
jgi:acyl transferase domain-containing protein